MSSYRIEQLTVNQLDRIVLPRFQRGFVWTKAKKNDFVQTLHDGYPFGSLLVYPMDNSEKTKLQLLDGQQRLSTIREYESNPLRFWKPLNHDAFQAIYQRANALLPDEKRLSEKDFDALVNSDYPVILRQLSLRIDDMDTCLKFTECINELQIKLKEYVDLDQLTVPMIVYLGGEEHLADVFANLNKGGVPLSKYEVFGASWVNATIQLASAEDSALQNQILQNVKNYYNDMQQNAEFDIEGFSEDELTRIRTITLAELGTALGQYVVDHLPALIPPSASAKQEIGFGLLGIAVNLDNRKLSNLNNPEYREFISKNLEEILQRTALICSNLQSLFSVLLKRFKDNGDNYENGLSTTFKTLSYFAALWHLQQSSEEYKESLRNIKAAYVYDAITSAWSSHGDQRLLDYYQAGSRNYLTPISEEQFRSAFDHWNDDQTSGIVFGKDTKCLVTIHANLSYLSASVPDGEAFELEHIIARKRINEVDTSGNRKILGSSLGNCMYLPRTDNNRKKDKTLYEVNSYGQYDQLIEESQYFSEEEMNVIEHALETKDVDIINDCIRRRSQRVAYELVDHLLSGSIPR